MGAGCVLTGGGARLPGLLETAESLLHVQGRMASPVPLSRMPASSPRPNSLFLTEPCSTPTAPARNRAAENHGLRAKLRAIFAGSV